MAKRKALKSAQKKEVFDWASLICAGMIAASGLMSDDPKVQQACGDTLNDMAGRPRQRLPIRRSSRRSTRRK